MTTRSERFRKFILAVAPFLSAIGVAAILSDGILTPAISVLGAVQGITIVSPSLTQHDVVGITIVILGCLYLVQHFGTGRITSSFSPIISVWFLALAAIGIYNINQHPAVLRAFGPDLAFKFFIRNKYQSWVSLGAIFLTVTGSEALFADLGHSNAAAIRIGASFVVLPSLLICYCGQAAGLIINPSNQSNTFYNTMPGGRGVLIFMLILATMAAVIASQAIISATFSLISQAMQLDFFPRLTVKHTSKYLEGRVYVPEVNYAYMVLVIAIVAGYENAVALGYAYGVAVSLVFFITTLFYTLAIVVSFDKPWWVAAFFLASYSLIDVSFLSSNLLKFVTGGWFTVTVTIVVFLAMMIWRNGRAKMLSIQKSKAEPLTNLTEANATESDGLHQQKQQPYSCDTLICYTKHIGHTPQMLMQLKRNIAVNPRQLILLHVKPATSPYVLKNVALSQLSPHIFLAVIEYGYCDPIPKFAYIKDVLVHAMSIPANIVLSAG